MAKAVIVVDLGYGDAGKGAHVDYLCRTQDIAGVIRFNGGGQAGHNVVTADGRHHNFHQFGAGTFAGVDTYLSRFVKVSPLALFHEANELQAKGVVDPWLMLYVDVECPVVTPFHEAANQLKELARGDGRHGSCGMGIGELHEDMLNSGSPWLNIAMLYESTRHLRQMLDEIQDQKRTECNELIGSLRYNPDAQWAIDCLTDDKMVDDVIEFYQKIIINYLRVTSGWIDPLTDGQSVVFEGAQGVLLDELWGFNPYTTWSNTTRKNADKLLRISHYSGEIVCHGLTRAYGTRHGRGPFPTEDTHLTRILQDRHNPTNTWQEGFRVGHLDLVTLQYALECNGRTDGIVVSNMDRVEGMRSQVCVDYVRDQKGDWGSELYWTHMNAEFLSTAEPIYREVKGSIVDEIEQATKIPVVTVGYGPTAEHRETR